MEAGQLVSDDLILEVAREELAKPEAANGVIFDGVVRTIPQAEGVNRLPAERNRTMSYLLFFDVADQEILARLERRRTIEGRVDDDPAALVVRLEAYRRETAPCWRGTRREGWCIGSVRSAESKRSRSRCEG